MAPAPDALRVVVADDEALARRMLTTLRNPEPTTVTTINKVVVKIILTEMLGPPLLAIAAQLCH